MQIEERVDQGRRLVNMFLGTSLGALFISVFYPLVKYLSPPKLAEPTTFKVTLPWKTTEEIGRASCRERVCQYV